MGAAVCNLHQQPAFRNVADALAWSDQRRLGQQFWKSQQAPPVDATGVADIDDHLVATFTVLVGQAGNANPLRERLAFLNQNATLLSHWAGNAERAGQRIAAELHRRAQEIVCRWSTEISAASIPHIA